MTRLLSLFLLAAALSTALAADITGTWEAQVNLTAGTGTVKFVFQQKGEALTGNYHGQFGEAPLKGTVKGDVIEFEFEVSGARILYKGKIEAVDRMKGTCDYAGQADGSWTATKK